MEERFEPTISPMNLVRLGDFVLASRGSDLMILAKSLSVVVIIIASLIIRTGG
ncbi:MAG TPA: hypothetical protein VFV34_10500 [Blastocatellia bacterium]|nr:hypothetical protein [Blastocatellia bacterium]